MVAEPFDLRTFLAEAGEKFQRRKKRDGETLRRLMEHADEEGALYIPEDANGPTIAEALIFAAEKNPYLGVHGLQKWLSNMPPLRRHLLTLHEIVEVIDSSGDLT
jgi:hypothetical protein